MAQALSAAPPPRRFQKATPQQCAMLDEPHLRGRMDGLLKKLLEGCGREHELGRVEAPSPGGDPAPATKAGHQDVPVNDPSRDLLASSHTQSETSLAYDPTSGVLCAGYNDSQHGVDGSGGFTGFSRSIDGGATFTDGGSLGAGSFGDPSVVWRRADGKFYFAALETDGLGLWRSDDQCRSFTFAGNIHVGNDDKELMAADNHPATSPYFGRLYVVWTSFSAGGRIASTYSDDGGVSWSQPEPLSDVADDVQGAWPAVAPNGDVFAGWVRWNPFPDGPIDIEIARSSDGGESWTKVTPPLAGALNPRNADATAACNRPSLNGNIRYLPSPQLAVGPDGVLHVVYATDPDGLDSGDEIDVYYRRSQDSGATWGPQIRLNDDATTADQFFPSISVSPENVVTTAWYDRRRDPLVNVRFDHFETTSRDGGITFEANRLISDQLSPVYLDPQLATCYHGDYDSQVAVGGNAVVLWADDRNFQDGHRDSDVYADRVDASDDFLVLVEPPFQEVCAPADATATIDVLQFHHFDEPVTLATDNVPPGMVPSFDANPVIPPGSSQLTVAGSGAAAAGAYVLEVRGTSSPGGVVRATDLQLRIVSQVPPAPPLSLPVDDAMDVQRQPLLTWEPALQASSYTAELATDPAFTNVLFTTETVATRTGVAVPLAPATDFFWRVKATNACGTGAFSATFRFTTLALPPILLVDDDDNTPNVRGFYTAALDALGADYDTWDTGTGDDEPDFSDLEFYEAVIWFTGNQFGDFAGPDAAGEAALAAWLDSSAPAERKCLFISSQDYHFDRGLTSFMSAYLGVLKVTDDVVQDVVTGRAPVFSNQGSFVLSPPFVDFSDALVPGNGGEVAFSGNGGDAATTRAASYRTIFFAFPFESLPGTPERQQVLRRALDFCGGTLLFADDFESGDTSLWSSPTP